ncbi:DUF2946 family protein [Deinococcus sp. QL22]|uniref:DUF2946 family protein n=1 Tax=Deinococcus sp. QL22 TaxID=2939437 RepID=UPI002016C8F7|nr:DUF2946 family protein [Deinococcus sp. QL22]UQN07905.1 hypothetical protein M1R55_14375 [Deinococcus sp. QL22]
MSSEFVPLGPQLQMGAAPGHMHGQPAGDMTRAERRESHNSQHHQAHCLFCLTGAFALTAESAAPPPAPVIHLTPASPLVVQSRAAALRHADARAPPSRA